MDGAPGIHASSTSPPMLALRCLASDIFFFPLGHEGDAAHLTGPVEDSALGLAGIPSLSDDIPEDL